MAVDYAKVLTALDCEFVGVSRSPEAAERFAAATGKKVFSGGVAKFGRSEYSRAIVAVGVDDLFGVTKTLLDLGVRNILVEKPGSLESAQFKDLRAIASKTGADVRIGYNRRFYASTLELARRLRSEQVLSFHFEFTEWSHRLESIEMPEVIKRNWLVANSSHVIDLAFYIGGTPQEMVCNTRGGLDWHSAGAIFTGAGATPSGALFSYHANWLAPGRWSLEVLTRESRYIMKPLEELRIQPKGTVEIQVCAIDDSLDKSFKPGLYRQVQAFFSGDKSLPTLTEQHRAFDEIYSKILSGGVA